MIIPGFVPDPLGEIYDYMPNLLELMVSFGIWATGLLIFTLLMKVAIPIETGEFTHSKYNQRTTVLDYSLEGSPVPIFHNDPGPHIRPNLSDLRASGPEV